MTSPSGFRTARTVSDSQDASAQRATKKFRLRCHLYSPQTSKISLVVGGILNLKEAVSIYHTLKEIMWGFSFEELAKRAQEEASKLAVRFE